MKISNREREVLYLIAHEHTVKEIAARLFISPHTVQTHRKKLLKKFDVKNVAGMVRVAFQRGCLLQLLLVMGLYSANGTAQTLQVEQGPPIIDGGHLMVGKADKSHISFDVNQIQSLYGQMPSALFLNHAGGPVHIGGLDSPNAMSGNLVISNNSKQYGLRITQGPDVSLDSKAFLMLGQEHGLNLVFDNNEIQARYNGQPADLFLNHEGGHLFARGLRDIGDKNNMQYNSSTGEIGYDNSSRRFKSNISTLEDDWQKILKVRPVKYDRAHSPGDWEYGYIAEEMDSLELKNLVFYDQRGRPENFNYRKMVLYITEVLKIQQKAIARMESALGISPTINSEKVGVRGGPWDRWDDCSTAEIEALEAYYKN